MQRVLFATTDYSFFTAPVSQALGKLGYQVQLFDYYKPHLLSRICGLASNLHILSQQVFQKKNLNFINQALFKQVDRFKPHYLLVIKGETIFPQTIRSIGNKGVVTINWYSDWFDSWRWIAANAQYYSLFVNMCRDTHKKLKKEKVNSAYLPVASYLDTSFQKVKKIYPVTFVGVHTPRREKYFYPLKDFGLQVWGYKKWEKSSLKDVFHGPVSVLKTRQIIRQSQITVNILNGSENHEPNQINTRIVEAASVGSFILTKNTPILRQYFVPGKEIAIFTTPQDLYQKVDYYLKHSRERNRIARAGYLRVKKDHTFFNRLPKLFSLAPRPS